MTEASGAPLGDLLERARKELGISGREAARRAGISDGRWRQVIRGESVPARTVVAMALAVEVDPAAALNAAGLTTSPEGVAALVSDARRRSVEPRTAPAGLVAEIERIKGMSLDPSDKIRIVTALLDLYQEKADQDASAGDRTALA